MCSKRSGRFLCCHHITNVNLDQNGNVILALILKIVVSGIVIVMSSISSGIPTESLINLPPLEKVLFTGTCIIKLTWCIFFLFIRIFQCLEKLNMWPWLISFVTLTFMFPLDQMSTLSLEEMEVSWKINIFIFIRWMLEILYWAPLSNEPPLSIKPPPFSGEES